jgi:hypothetical protein
MEIIMVLLLGYQVFMPAVDNGRYQMVWDGQNIIRINTQDGTMERCNRETLKCAKVQQKEPKLEEKDEGKN